MTISVTARGSGARNTGGESTYSISPSGTLGVGSRAVLCLGCDNSETGGLPPMGLTSVTDSLGNVWRYRQTTRSSPGNVANDGAAQAIYDCLVKTPITASDTITVTFSTTTVARAYAIWELTTNIADLFVMPVWQRFGGNGASSTPTTSGLANSIPSSGDACIGLMVAEGNGAITQDTDTTNGSWSTHRTAAVGSGTSGIELSTQYKVVTAAGAQTFNQGLHAVIDNTIFMAVYTEGLLSAGAVGSGATNTGGQNTIVASPTIATKNTDLKVGDLAILVCAYDNSGTNGADPYSSITDSVGNTWSYVSGALRDPGAANTGVCYRMFVSLLKTALTSSDTITVSLGGITTVARAWVLWGVEPALNHTPRFITAPEAAGASTTPSVTLTGALNKALIIGGVAIEYGSPTTGLVQDADTTNGSWSTTHDTFIGTTTSGVTVASQAKSVKAAGDQTYNVTYDSSDWGMGLGEIVADATMFAGLSAGLSKDKSSVAAGVAASSSSSGAVI